MLRTIRLSVEDKPGVLMRVVGTITAKGENIHALTVDQDPDRPGLARILLVASIDSRLKHRIVSEMNRLVQVLEAVDISEEASADGCQ
jgi:acetolactate synthase-1/3 small subunit